MEHKMDMGIEGKRVLVTGGSRGVGRAIVLALAREGAHVGFSFAHNREAADEVVRAAKPFRGQVQAFHADLGNLSQASMLYRQAREALGGIDILVNNAAIWLQGWLKDIPLEDWQTTMDVNLAAPFLLCQALVKDLLVAEKTGKIINITSQAAFLGSTTGHSHYAASKAGMVAMTVSLAREVAASGINVNALALGLVETDMLAETLKDNRAYYENRVPVGRLATPDDIAGFVLFLASRLSDYMTGATLDATGGMLNR